jgi:hypothetical protein
MANAVKGSKKVDEVANKALYQLLAVYTQRNLQANLSAAFYKKAERLCALMPKINAEWIEIRRLQGPVSQANKRAKQAAKLTKKSKAAEWAEL